MFSTYCHRPAQPRLTISATVKEKRRKERRGLILKTLLVAEWDPCLALGLDWPHLRLMAFANLIHGFCRFDSKAFELIDWNAKEFHHFQTSRSSNYPQLSVAHGVRDIMRGVQFMQMMGHLRWERDIQTIQRKRMYLLNFHCQALHCTHWLSIHFRTNLILIFWDCDRTRNPV